MKRVMLACVCGAAAALAGCLPAPATLGPASLTAPVPAVTAAATEVMAASVTPGPVQMPAPSDLVMPTAYLPAGPATPDPNLGVGQIAFIDPLDGSSGYNWAQESESAVFAILGGQL